MGTSAGQCRRCAMIAFAPVFCTAFPLLFSFFHTRLSTMDAAKLIIHHVFV